MVKDAHGFPVFAVTNRQIRTALRQSGLFAAVDGFIRSGAAGTLAIESWDYANFFEYGDPLLDQVVAALSLDKDELFALAASL